MNNTNSVSGTPGGLSVNTERWICICISLIVLVFIKNVSFPTPIAMIRDAALTLGGQNVLAILIFALPLWMTGAILFHFADLLAMTLSALFGVDSFGDIVKIGFGSINAIFFIGVSIPNAFVGKSGLGERFVNVCLSIAGSSTRYVILDSLAMGVLLSMWISSMATVAMLISLVESLLDEEGLKLLENGFGKILLISVVWGSLIGGSGTPAGNGPNPLAIGSMKDMVGIDVLFLDWMIYGVLISLIHTPITWGLLLLTFKPKMKYLKRTNQEIRNEFKNQPELSRDGKVTLILFIAMIMLQVFSSQLLDLSGVDIPIVLPAILTTMLLLFPGVSKAKYKEIEKEMSRGSITLVLFGVSLGMVLYQTGVANWVALGLLGNLGGLSSILMILAMVLNVSLVNITLSSATVFAGIIIPIIIELSINLGVSTLAMALPTALASSLAFILITSAPTNVIAYPAGYFLIKDFVKAGILMSIVPHIIVTVIMYGVKLLTGLY